MTINKILQWGIERLKKAGVSSPELDAELLLAQAVAMRICASVDIKKNNDSSRNGAIAPFREAWHKGVDRAWLYAHPEYQLTNSQLKAYQLFIKRRVRREPVAYILGHKEFYGLDFEVNKNVLIPRPETEILVELALNEIKNAVVVDVGTGSGAIIVSLAKQLNYQFFAIDNSLVALKVARKNARKHGVGDRIKFLHGNLLEPIIHDFAIASRHIPINKFNAVGIPHQWSGQSRNLIILANLPYVFASEYKKLQPEITKYEPRVAVDGGKDGLKYYREMFKQLSVFICNHPCVSVSCLCEIDPRQTVSFKKLARKYFSKAKFKIIKDLVGKNRAVKVRIRAQH